MAGDKTLAEPVGRIETTTVEIKDTLTAHTALLRASQDLLLKVLEAVTPTEGADRGVPLDELLAALVVEIREQGKKLDRIVQLLERSPAADGDGATAARNGAPPGTRR